MADKDREDAANLADDNEEREENGEQRPPAKKPESQSAPAPGDDIIIK